MKTQLPQITKVSLTLAAFIILIAGIMYAKAIVNPLLLALFISVICEKPLSWLKKKKVPEGLAVTIVMVGILLIYAGFIQLIGASLSMFLGDMPKYQESFNEFQASIIQYFESKGIDIVALGGEMPINGARVMEYTARIFGKLGDMMSNEITIILLTLFLIAEMDVISLKIKVVAKRTKVNLEYLNTITAKIRHYLTIKTLVSLLTGVLVGISLAFIGVDYPILWGLVAFLLNYIPTIGSVIAAIPAVLFSILELGFPASYITIAIYLIINFVLGNIIEPKIMGKGLGLSTFVVFFSLIFWGFILGPVGMFLSIPLMIMIKILLENNSDTKWIATLLGTKRESEIALNEED